MGASGALLNKSPLGTLMSKTYFSEVFLGYHIAPRRRFTFLSRNLYFSPPPSKLGIGISS